MKSFSVAIVFTLLAQVSFAQMHGMSVPRSPNPGGPMFYGNPLPDFFVPHRFLVVFTNGKDTILKARINPQSPHNLISVGGLFKKDGAYKVFPSETQALVRLDYPEASGDSILDTEYPAVPSDSCWLFKLKEGKITTYASSAEGMFPLDTSLLYIQKGEGPILSYSAERLAAMISDYPRGLRVLSEARIQKAIELYNKR